MAAQEVDPWRKPQSADNPFPAPGEDFLAYRCSGTNSYCVKNKFAHLRVRNCGGYLIYYLKKFERCSRAYCAVLAEEECHRQGLDYPCF